MWPIVALGVLQHGPAHKGTIEVGDDKMRAVSGSLHICIQRKPELLLLYGRVASVLLSGRSYALTYLTYSYCHGIRKPVLISLYLSYAQASGRECVLLHVRA